MATPEQVQVFLKEFFAKKKVFGIVTRERDKNLQTLFDLGMTMLQRNEIIDSLTVSDYFKGPTTDTLHKSAEMWEFGKSWKQHLLYIKITMGENGKPVVCISFHTAEHKIEYPYKK